MADDATQHPRDPAPAEGPARAAARGSAERAAGAAPAAQPWAPAGATPWQGRPDASMTLINEMLHRPLDPSYAAEAERREAVGLPRQHSNRWRLAVIAFLIGLLLVTAGRTLRQPKDAVAGQKQALIAQIRSQQSAGDALAAQQATLQAEVAAARGEALAGASREDLTERLRTGEILAGTSAVTGPALVLTIDDAERAAGQGSNGDPRGQSDQDMGTVVSRDLQLVVNGLWQAGAEAIGINGQRLTSTSAIRFAGDAILVDYRPLARPYVVTAIGDPATLEDAFTHTEGGAYVQGLADSYGIEYERARRDSATLPAGGTARLRHARAPGSSPTTTAPAGAPSSSARPTASETRP